MLTYIKTENPGLGEIDLTKEINTLLSEDKKVLWIISGGSNISVELTIMRQLDKSKTSNLRIILGDERYGQKNQQDSNEKALLDNGFNPDEFNFIPVLEEKSLGETTMDFSNRIDEAMNWADFTIGQFGIGSDGHISGVLPESIGVTEQGNAVSYQGPDFTRITMTLSALSKINLAYVFAFGSNKIEALTNLKNKSLDINSMPSLVLYNIGSVYLYNNNLGDKE